MIKFTLAYSPDLDSDSEIGMVGFNIEAENFRGNGNFMSTMTEVAALAHDLRDSAADEIRFACGWDDREGDNAILLLAACKQSNADLEMTLELADFHGVNHRLSSTFLVDQRSAGEFIRGLETIVRDGSGTAALIGKDL